MSLEHVLRPPAMTNTLNTVLKLFYQWHQTVTLNIGNKSCVTGFLWQVCTNKEFSGSTFLNSDSSNMPAAMIYFIWLYMYFLYMHWLVYELCNQLVWNLLEEWLKWALPGLAVGESMDLDSLLPPALSESLHIPPPWLVEVQGRKGAWIFSAKKKTKNFTATHVVNKLLLFSTQILGGFKIIWEITCRMCWQVYMGLNTAYYRLPK